MAAKSSPSRGSSAEIGFEQQIWEAADILRGNMDAAEYKHVVLGLIFLKYVSDRFEQRYHELEAVNDDLEDPDAYAEKNVFFVPDSARWRRIASQAFTERIGEVIDEAMRKIEECNGRLKGILPKNYSRPELDKRRLGEVVNVFTNVRMNVNSDKDLLGRTYEYCLAKFAEQEGRRAGEFYTPSSVVRTLVEVLQPFKGRVYDPCCGSGGMFVQSANFVESHSGNIGELSIYGQDNNPTTRKMAIMNLAIRGIEANLGGSYADTFHNDLHPTLRADYILANPPFNQSNWDNGSLKLDPRWKYGKPPIGNANFAWLQHMIHHLAPNGRLGLVLANGSLTSTSGGENVIRSALVKDDLVEGIVSMPSQLFYTTQIPVSLWFISRNKKVKNRTLFIDARNMGRMVNRRWRELTNDDIDKIAGCFKYFNAGNLENVNGFCAAVDTNVIGNNDYILTPGRYVGLAERDDNDESFEIKMEYLTNEISELFKKSNDLQDKIRKKLGELGYVI
jgi:type I restriction enzyme M protein